MVLALLALVLFLGGVGLSRLKLDLDIYESFDPDFRSSRDLHALRRSYRENSQLLVAFEFERPAAARELCLLQRWERSVHSMPDVKSVTSLWSQRGPRSDGVKLWYPRKLADPCEQDPAVVPDVAGTFRDTPSSPFVSARGTRDVLFDVTFADGAFRPGLVEETIRASERFLRDHGLTARVHGLGLSASRYHFLKIMYRDALLGLSVLVVLVLALRAIAGTWRSGVLLSLTLLLTAVVLYGGLGLAGIPVNILTNNLLLMTAVAGTADFLFVTQAQFSEDLPASFTELAVPCFFTTLTTVLGFLSLNTSAVDLIQDFGTGAALGALLEWVMIFGALPALLRVTGQERPWIDRDRAWNFSRLDRFVQLRPPAFTLALGVVLMVLAVPAFFFLNDEDSPVENLPRGHEFRVSTEYFRKQFGWEGQVYVYFPTAPDVARSAEIVDRLARLPLVSKVEDPESIAADWTRDQPPLRRELLRRELELSPLWRRYHSPSGELRLPLYLPAQNLRSLKRLRDEVAAICGVDCRLAGQRVVYLEYGETITRTMIESFAVSLLLVVATLGWLLKRQGRLSAFVPVAISALLGPGITLTLMALLQVPVTLVTSIFLAVMVGLAGDNAIQYLLAGGPDLEAGIDRRAVASVLVTGVMIAGSALFLLQTLSPMRILGGLFMVGFLINILGDLWGLRGLLGAPTPRR
jgi:predicted RND superfamily exporter protein